MAVATAICRKCGREIFKTYLYDENGTWMTVQNVPREQTCKSHEPYGS